MNGELTVVLLVGRARALTRASLWLAGAVVLGATAFAIYRSLDLRPTGASNRLVEYAIALGALPLAILTLVTVFKGVRWLLLAVWPVRVAIVASPETLELRLGPFGQKTYPARALDVKYPYELSADEDEDGGFEAFLPEEEQHARLLPRILHPETAEPIHRIILRFAGSSEKELAVALRPMIEAWKSGGAD